MDIDSIIREGIRKALKHLFNHSVPVEEIKLQPTVQEYEGSHTFVVFPYLKISKLSPENTARKIGEYLVENTDVLAAFNVIKGFLNLTLSDTSLLHFFNDCYSDPSWGQLTPNGKRVRIEYSSPNTNKPLHLGHLRNNFLGYSLAKILEATGHEVKKVNLINDRGIHICKSMLAYQKYGRGETPQSSGIKGDHLIGKYYVLFDSEYRKQVEKLTSRGMDRDEAQKAAPLMQEAQEMLRKWEEKEEGIISLWKQMNEWVYEGFNETYHRMGVSFDTIYHESETYLLGKDIVTEGLEKGVFYRKPDGSVWVDLSKEGLDEKLLLRSDGTSVYITQDMGTADMKYRDWPFDESVYVVGNEQDYHFEVLFRIMKKLGRPYASGMYHLSYGMVDLPSGKMKSREGTVVDADDFMEEMNQTARKQTEELGKIEDFSSEEAIRLYHMIGMGALKYFLLKIDPKKRMMFNPQESIQFQGHTGPFIQYTHARLASILRKAEEMEIHGILPVGSLHPTERLVLIVLNEFRRVLKEAAGEYAPSIIANFCYELAKEYNRLYTEVSILNEPDISKRHLRVAISQVTAKTIRLGMGLLGIEVPDRM